MLYGTDGNVDVSDAILWLYGFSPGGVLTVDGRVPSNTVPPPLPTLAVGVPLTYNIADRGALTTRLGQIKTGAVGTLDLTLLTPTSSPQIISSSIFGAEDLGVPAFPPCLPTDPTCIPPEERSALGIAYNLAWRNWLIDNPFSQAFVDRGLCVGAAKRLKADIEQAAQATDSPLRGWPFQLVNGCALIEGGGRRDHEAVMVKSPNGNSWLVDSGKLPGVCRMIPQGNNTWTTPGCSPNSCTWNLDTLLDPVAAAQTCRLPEKTGSLPQQPINSFDPNLKIGARGGGTPAYVSGDRPLRYTIFFENSPSATAPAQEVLITDQLDAATLELSTLNLGPISFGNTQVTPPAAVTSFAHDLDLRPARNLVVKVRASLNSNTGILTWRLTSIDPATGDLPADPRVGFLPPNANPPEGDGSVVFTVMAKHALPTGTEIRNRASITFDLNAPINTPEWLNALDNAIPSSRVSPLPATQASPTFPVQLSGSDLGSGIQDFTVYISDNGGAFLPWLTNTTATQSTYTGIVGHTYGFYSIARDLAGNTEAAKTTAEATTTVAPQTACASDATTQFTIVRSGFRFNNATRRFLQTISITKNSTTQPLSGPFALALESLSSTAALYNPAGTTACALPAGRPFALVNPGPVWNPGQSVTINLEFVNPTNAGITYTPRVLAGGPNR